MNNIGTNSIGEELQDQFLLPLKMRSERGMTLIEVLAVVVLLGVIIGVILPNVFNTSSAAKARVNELQMEKIVNALGNYRLQVNRYPDKLGDVAHPFYDADRGINFVPTLEEKDLKDVWGGDFIYKVENNGRRFALTSLGEDGAPGGEGANTDITKSK